MRASGDGGDCISVEREGGNTGGGKYDGLVAASAFSDAGLSKAVQAPGPYIFFILLNCERMVNAAADQSAFFIQAQRSWDERVEALALENTMAELILLAGSPDKDFAILSKSHGMISAANDLLHVAEIW